MVLPESDAGSDAGTPIEPMSVKDIDYGNGLRVHLESREDGLTGYMETPVGDRTIMRSSVHRVEIEDSSIPIWIELHSSGDETMPSRYVRMEVRNGVPEVTELRTFSRPGEPEVRPADVKAFRPADLTSLFATQAIKVTKSRDYDVPTIPGNLRLKLEDDGRVTGEFKADGQQGSVPVSHLTRRDDGAWIVRLDQKALGESIDGGIDQVPIDVAAEAIRSARSSKGARRITPTFLARVAEIYRANLDHAPTLAVQKAFVVSPRMASEYVQRARRAGLLPPTTPGKKKG